MKTFAQFLESGEMGPVKSKEKTVTLKHSKSGKEIVVVAKALKKYQKLGYELAEELDEGQMWKKFMKMLTDFNDRMNIDSGFEELIRTAQWAARITNDPDQKKKIKAFAAGIAKADMSTVAGRNIIAKLEKDIAPILKSLNATIKFESEAMQEAKLAGLADIPKMSDKSLLRLWNQAKDDQVSPQFGQLLKRVRQEIKKRGLKVKP